MKHVALRTLLPALLLASLHAQSPRPLPASLQEAYKDSFLIGAALNRAQFTDDGHRDAALMKAQFGSITPENILKWEAVHPKPDTYAFTDPDRYVAYGERNSMFIVGHTLVWHSQTPRWVFEDDKGAPLTRDALLARMKDHITTVVGRYKGRINGWDVVNEALNEDGTLRQSPWMKIIGEDYIEKAFQYAHEADPRAELYYNDYNVENEAKRKGAVELIKKLKARGVAIAGIGLQGHNKLDWPTIAQQDATILAFSELGIKVCITELDVDPLPRGNRPQTADVGARVEARPDMNPYVDGLPDNVQQALARRYADLFGVYAKYRGTVTRVTFWGVSDEVSWLNNFPIRGRTNHPLLFDRKGQPKPAYNSVLRAAGLPRAQYDESKIPPYTLPDALVLQNGRKVTDTKTWTTQRRAELLSLFETHVFGRTPVERPKEMTWKVTAEDRQANDGKSITKTVRLLFNGREDGPFMDLKITLPNSGKPVPVFLLAGGFGGNTQLVLDRGYGVVAANITQIQADNKTSYAKSIRAFYGKPGQTEAAPEEWGSIAAWAWGLSRAMDYIETDKDMDAKKVSLNGVSRYGKVVMWAGARDTRFAITFSGEAGCGGQVILRRGIGETVRSINNYAPHWYNGKFKEYGDKVSELPVDFHELVALYAPRPVYIATAQQDYWGDPRGSFLAGAGAEPVYKLFGKTGLGTTEWPAIDTQVGDFIGYHNRTGSHGQNNYDWEQFLKFADRHYGR